MITVSLEKPANASRGASRPVIAHASMTPRATTSAAMRSQANSTTAAATMARQVAISGVMAAIGRRPPTACRW